jgi:hypothetical protein
LFGLTAGANQRWEEPRPWGEAVGVQRLNIGSRMSREAHVRFWERVGVRFPCATRPYIKVAGQWQYLYRAIDRDGNLVDVYLSETRDMAAAKAFLRSARSVTQVEPEQVTTDGHTSYPKAIADELGTDVDHRTSQYKNNVIEQNHRGLLLLCHKAGCRSRVGSHMEWHDQAFFCFSRCRK